ncbi:hypothetical protein Sjap_009274 [Stephania japonica]|uniref:Uncharacterized protein n=1 Tax=Stephania japonica TaxID=461633 RepID=A0AAP0JS15_9MAGN
MAFSLSSLSRIGSRSLLSASKLSPISINFCSNHESDSEDYSGLGSSIPPHHHHHHHHHHQRHHLQTRNSGDRSIKGLSRTDWMSACTGNFGGTSRAKPSSEAAEERAACDAVFVRDWWN